jgi:hypothetical protein
MLKAYDKYLSSSDKNWQLFEQYVIEDAGYYGKDWLEKKEFDKFLERISDRLEGFKKLFNTDHQYNNFVNKIKTNFKII